MTNVFEPEWDQDLDSGPYRWRRSRIGRRAGSEKLGASLYEVPPGASTWPFHAHHANEELLVVLAGAPTLRTPDGERVLAPGETVAFPAGKGGAHRLDNRSEGPVRVLVVSTMIGPEMNVYPDSGKLWGLSFAPGGERTEDDDELVGRTEANLVHPFLDGES